MTHVQSNPAEIVDVAKAPNLFFLAPPIGTFFRWDGVDFCTVAWSRRLRLPIGNDHWVFCERQHATHLCGRDNHGVEVSAPISNIKVVSASTHNPRNQAEAVQIARSLVGQTF